MNKLVLLTGGGGFVGSHCAVELIKDGFDILIVENWSNSSKECITAIEKITGQKIKVAEMDICNREALDNVFSENKIYAVVHLAGFKSVPKSLGKPIEYYTNNIYGTLVLLDVMRKHNVKNFLFSGSCTTYGKPKYLPVDENHPRSAEFITNPYGRSKYMIECILKDVYLSDPEWNIIILRYFNPVGAHESGLIGEDPIGVPNNLVPYISQVALGRLPELKIFGNDYDTPDGTCIRDFTHICDLCRGHSLAIKKLDENPGFKVYNLGKGHGFSVMQVVNTFEKVTGIELRKKFVERRTGDVPHIYASSALAEKELGWEAVRTLEDMCRDTWNWQIKNPKGYNSNGF